MNPHCAAGPRIDLADGIGEVLRTPPPLQALDLCPRLEDNLARGVEYTSDDEFLFGGIVPVSRHLSQPLFQTIQRLIPTLNCVELLDHAIAIRGGWEQQSHSKEGLGALLLECHRLLEIRVRSALLAAVMNIHQPLRLHDLCRSEEH